MPVNTTFNPATNEEFDKSKLLVADTGVSGICPAGQSANIDLNLTDDMLINGVQVLASGTVFGDTITLQVVDEAGTLPNGLSFPVGTVLDQFGTNIGIPSDKQEKIMALSSYPAKIYAGLTLRVIYNSIGSNSVNIEVNYKLHKVLI